MMDPDATYKIMVDESNDLDERAVAATDMLCWGVTARLLRPAELADECRTVIFKALDRLAELEGEMFATLTEVTDAARAGKRVCWKQQSNYIVVPSGTTRGGGWDIECTNNGHRVGLFYLDGVRSDYDPADFYIEEGT